MHIGQRGSVRVSLALTILLAIALSWVLSTGIGNYFNYLSIRSLHETMVSHPEIYSRPIPAPRFGITEFLTGRPPLPPPEHGRYREPPPPPEDTTRDRPPINPVFRIGRPPMGEPHGGPQPPAPVWGEMRWLLLRLGVALALALLAAVLLGRRFSKPLTELAKGAEAFQSGDLAYRIPAGGKDEFASVASAMNQMARQVSDHISSLEDDAEHRRRLLADIAHELRSPVTTMRTMAGALRDGVADQPERRARAVGSLVNTSERLLRLVQDLMVLAKLDLNELPFDMRRVDIGELVRLAVQSHESEAAGAGITLHPLEISSSIKATADPDRITQVVDNILQNAISYAGEGAEVRVSIDDGETISIRIADTGKGIPAADLPYIFDSFYRADSARTPGDCHSGLGLSIARRLVEAHGGQLTVESASGKGTVVTILIPREKTSSPQRSLGVY